MPPGAASEPRPEAASSRLAWLDLYRGAAVLVMIEAHVCNTFLAPAQRATEWFAWVNYLNGIIAPAFLFIAGYAHGLGGRRSPARPGVLGRRLRRLAVVAAIGFALHFPWKELLAGRWADALRAGTMVDILPCLAAAITVLVLLETGLGRWTKAGVAALTIAALVLAPQVQGWTGGPVPLVAWVNRSTGSLFPLLPWVAFAWIGWLLSAHAPDLRVMGAAVTVAATAGVALRHGEFSAVGPAFFFERLAWVLALVPACVWIAQKWAPRPITFAGEESLTMYVAHLLIIPALAGLGIASVGVPATAGLYALVLGGSFAATATWRHGAHILRRATDVRV